jgi:hypothetical protein
VACPKCVAVATGTFAGDVPEGACAAEFYLNLGGSGAAGGAVSVCQCNGTWVGGLRQGCGITSVAVQTTAGSCTVTHDGMYCTPPPPAAVQRMC